VLGAEVGVGLAHRVARIVHGLGGDEVRRHQTLQPREFALRRGFLHFDQRDLGLGLGHLGLGAGERETRIVVFLLGKDLTLGDALAFLDIDALDHACAPRGDLDDAAFHVRLAVGDGGVGAVDGVGLGRRHLRLGGFHLALHE
jgi:hypothetical protein